MTKRFKVGVVGATGMVGQRFISLLQGHPWFTVTKVAASARSAGKTYAEATRGRWAMKGAVPSAVSELVVGDASNVAQIADGVDFVFCAVEMSKDETRALEDAYARHETPVLSNNSAHRGTPDVPMMMPELNSEHAAVIHHQRQRLGVKRGFVAVKPNCSLQSYLPALHPLRDLGLRQVVVATYQAISGAGKTFETWPEMMDNVIPLIKGEEEKSEQEPLKIWGSIKDGLVVPATAPLFSAQCIRVPVTDGHLAAVSLSVDTKVPHEEIIRRWRAFQGKPQALGLPSAPTPFITYFEEESRPQTRLDRDAGNGMGITVGRLRGDNIFDYRFVTLSHNTVRGAAGGAILTAELLAHEGYIEPK
jgi:aspartate-semialdehyde dehydrogenase